MFLLDPEGDRIVEANEAACELLGYSMEELTTAVRVSDIHPQEMTLFRAFGEEVYQNGLGSWCTS